MTTPFATWESSETRHLGQRIHFYESIDSTNTQALALAHDPDRHGLVLLADRQTSGRGQYGRSWQCEPGSGVLMSVLLFPPPHLLRPALLTAWAAVSVCEFIRKTTGLQAKIKWPNDVLLRGRKVCGILIEQSRGTVAGLGLNLNQTAEQLAAADLPQAASLRVFTGQTYDPRRAARDLLRELDEEYDRLHAGDLFSLESCWAWRLGLLGKPVVAEGIGNDHHGRLVDLTFDAVTLETARGPVRLAPETVRQLRAFPSLCPNTPAT